MGCDDDEDLIQILNSIHFVPPDMNDYFCVDDDDETFFRFQETII